jgi:hypothetical protein
MRWGRLGIVGASVLLVAHIVLFAGVDLGHRDPPVTAPTVEHQQAR